ncbi:MAG: PCMD domain-containing protein [Bacteroidetes bacterium]|nr:PCMD domain-containing protein [Bacteroidota bacterium]
MRKYLLSVLFFFAFTCVALGQTTLPNMGMNEWAMDTSGYYEEPTGGVWTTANKVCLLNPAVFKVTTFKTTDANSGAYAARIVTDTVGLEGPDLLLTGTLATGTFDEHAFPPENLKMGMPFTGRPTRFKTWFKYLSVNHDSCDMWCMLTKWNPEKMGRDTIGMAWYTDSVLVSQYTLLDTLITYYSEENPDSIALVYAPSAAGDLFLGQHGSTLFVDDITLEYSNGFNMVLMPELDVTCYPNPANQIIRFEMSEEVKDVQMQVFDAEGKIMSSLFFSGRIVSVDLKGYADGTYYYYLNKGLTPLNSGTFLKSGH